MRNARSRRFSDSGADHGKGGKAALRGVGVVLAVIAGMAVVFLLSFVIAFNMYDKPGEPPQPTERPEAVANLESVTRLNEELKIQLEELQHKADELEAELDRYRSPISGGAARGTTPPSQTARPANPPSTASATPKPSASAAPRTTNRPAGSAAPANSPTSPSASAPPASSGGQQAATNRPSAQPTATPSGPETVTVP